jgi:hypothetical protein
MWLSAASLVAGRPSPVSEGVIEWMFLASLIDPQIVDIVTGVEILTGI